MEEMEEINISLAATVNAASGCDIPDMSPDDGYRPKKARNCHENPSRCGRAGITRKSRYHIKRDKLRAEKKAERQRRQRRKR